MRKYQTRLGIKLKDDFRKERKKQRELQEKFELSLYLQPFVAQMSCQLTVKDGIFSFPNGVLPDGKYIYVRTLEGKIFACKEEEVAHHSYLSNGKKVLSAGSFIFEKGRLCLVSNESGHYTPTNSEMQPEIEFYYSVAQNPDLIYEDHSKNPSQKIINQYKAKDIVEKHTIDTLKPLASFNNRTSKFGLKLNSRQAAGQEKSAGRPGSLFELSFFWTKNLKHFKQKEVLTNHSKTLQNEPHHGYDDEAQLPNPPHHGYDDEAQLLNSSHHGYDDEAQLLNSSHHGYDDEAQLLNSSHHGYDDEAQLLNSSHHGYDDEAQLQNPSYHGYDDEAQLLDSSYHG
ncbi:Uncharacterised protein [Legionella steigerwaltii]|uniref:Uncharacterized protein n=1 Tax=Legionella steigerwaltii TaxID=460 RepID=A0A378L599_9GAMM|nr:hypothetical protein [Legionella steigerwaltii]KTD77260.1 hypothetical protein Lstg_1617 [Legionella steigerwaltii]STY21986.1 Uncharacterised protein [Legionella steigerwaltii]